MYLYKDSDIRFEYPDTPVNTDYMTLANSISTYSGHDLTILHPDTLEKNTYAKNKRLYLDSGMNHEALPLLKGFASFLIAEERSLQPENCRRLLLNMTQQTETGKMTRASAKLLITYSARMPRMKALCVSSAITKTKTEGKPISCIFQEQLPTVQI